MGAAMGRWGCFHCNCMPQKVVRHANATEHEVASGLCWLQAEAAVQQGKTLILFNPLLKDVASPNNVMTVR